MNWMFGFDILPWAGVAFACLSGVMIAVFLMAPQVVAPHQHPSMSASAMGTMVWLFDDTQLIDLSAGARLYLDDQEGEFEWSCLFAKLAVAFPGFPESPGKLKETSPVILAAVEPENHDTVTLEWIDGITRVKLDLADRQYHHQPRALPQHLHEELEGLREAVHKTPYPIWRLSDDETVIWCNDAYHRLKAMIGPNPSAGDSPLFPVRADEHTDCGARRLPVTVAGSENKLWFDVSALSSDDGALCYAIDVNSVVTAENNQRKFVQTLAKTFAHLSIGLAIFDRNRQLVMFNPALTDLTALSAEFLITRPNMLTFFDRLRDQRMMPEPKNYHSWRLQIAELAEAAADGYYHETWTLPSGSVYSVSGRPHPDGAIAFLFEDITAEITLTRRFREDLELGHSILDQMDCAIAVFGADGNLIVSNKAYQTLWAVTPEAGFSPVSIIDATRCWQDRCKATPTWGEIRDFITSQQNRVDWSADVRLGSGELLSCQIKPVQNGATLIMFCRETESDALQEKSCRVLVEQR